MINKRCNPFTPSKGSVLIWLIIILLVSLSGASYSLLSDSDNNNLLHVSALSPYNAFQLTPGKAKQETTSQTQPGEPEAQPVATLVDGKLNLTFGEIQEGSQKNFIDVFRVKNIWARKKPLTFKLALSDSLHVTIGGKNTPVLEMELKENAPNMGNPLTLEYGATAQVNCKFNKVPAGKYEGYIILTTLNNFLHVEIPTKAIVK